MYVRFCRLKCPDYVKFSRPGQVRSRLVHTYQDPLPEIAFYNEIWPYYVLHSQTAYHKILYCISLHVRVSHIRSQLFQPSLQIVSKVVGKKVSQAPELKQSVSKHRKSESDFSSTKSTTGASHLKVGSKVKFPLSNKTARGILKFIGPTKFSTGQWCGIELSRPDGRNNGTVKGVKYFQCKINYGIFVHAEKVTLDEEENVHSKRGMLLSTHFCTEDYNSTCYVWNLSYYILSFWKNISC